MTKSQTKNDPLGIGNRVRFFRKLISPKLTQETLGEMAFGKDNGAQSLMRRIESGEQELKASELKAIADVFSIRVEDLFAETINPKLVQRLKKSYLKKTIQSD